jgi:serine/threonine protein phosphatase PrpC
MLVQTPTEVELYTLSDVGPVREGNEDYCAATTLGGTDGQRSHLLVVADGLGGHLAGEVASRLAVDTLLDEAGREGAPIGDRFLGRAMQQANLAVVNHAHDNPACFNMQTTMTAVVVQYDRLLLAHAGDCRLYRVRGVAIEQLTSDHTRVAEMLRMRLISPEQAVKHPARNMLTRSLGADLIVQVDTLRDKVLPGDQYVLCSDGLWSAVTSDEIRRFVVGSSLEDAGKRLIALGTERGSSDNMTVGLMHVHTVTPAPVAVPRWKSWFGRPGTNGS